MKRNSYHYQLNQSNYQNELNQGIDDATANRTLKQTIGDLVPDDADSGWACIRNDEVLFSLLPLEIKTLVLGRLSVKTLCILKRICRYFNHLISSPNFIRTHLKLSSDDVSSSGYNKVIVRSLASKESFKQTSIQSLWRDLSIHSTNLKYPSKESPERVKLVGSCNGLVLAYGKDMLIWNPALREHNKLPDITKLDYLCGIDVSRGALFCGFGFDVLNDDYKVVVLVAYKGLGSERDYMAIVYSLKRSSWIRLPDFTGGKFTETRAKFASGKLHWLTTRGDIVSFDVEKEVFGTVEQPTYVKSYRSLNLTVVRGSVCVCGAYGCEVDVWVMKEYGINGSWTKIFTYNSSDDSFVSYILPNGEVIIDHHFLGMYNPKDESSRSIAGCYFYDPLFYVESLVSPYCN